MKDFLKRKITLFDRSIPISIILALSIFGIAFAAFTATVVVGQNVTAGDGPQYTWTQDWACTLIAGAGAIDSQTGSGDSFSFAGSGFDNDTAVECIARLKNDDSDALIYSLDVSALPIGAGVDVTCQVKDEEVLLGPCEGFSHPAGLAGSYIIELVYDYSTLVAGQSVAGDTQLVLE